MTGSESNNGSNRFSGRNKRRSSRWPPRVKELAAVYVGGERYSGEVLDESEGGLGILLDGSVEIRAGARVRVAAQRKCSNAIVVRCIGSDDGSIIGLRT